MIKFVFALIIGLGFWSFTFSEKSNEQDSMVIDSNVQLTQTTSDTLCNIFVPNAFTPDGNENNNVLKVYTVCEFDQFEFRIYNRAGDIVFVSEDPNMAWDGTYKGRVMKGGTYVYTIEYTLRMGEPTSLVGHVVLLK